MVINSFKEVDIREIIANKKIFIYFQPIVSVVKGRVIGVEALCRSFCHKENIVIPPYVLFSQFPLTIASYSSDAENFP